jgi:hypothetical protein
MTSRITLGCVAALLFALVIVVVGVKPSKSAQGENIDVQSWVWGITNNQVLRVCLDNVLASDPQPMEGISLNFVAIKDQFGHSLLERELRIRAGEFLCTDFSQPQLVAAGLIPEPSGRTQFLILVSGPNGANRSAESDAGRPLTIGSIETFDVADGQSRIYIGIHWRH